MYPRNRFYLAKHSNKYPTNITKAELLAKLREEFYTYHTSHGKDAFGSERSTPEVFEAKLPQTLEYEWNRIKDKQSEIHVVTLSSESDPKIKETEQQVNFVKWMTE